MKQKEKDSKKKNLNKNDNLSKFVNDVKKGKYSTSKVNSNLRVSVYTTNNTIPTYTFGVR